MAIPRQVSFAEMLKTYIKTFVYKSGVNDLAVGSVGRSIGEAAVLNDFKIQGDIMAALASVDVDNLSGADLDNYGMGKGVPRPQARQANGTVTISQQGFTKISTKVYQGTASPPAGSVTLNVADGSIFPNSGSLYIGRGTNNLEGPIAYSSVTQVGAYYQIALSSPTTKNHGVGESVILAQGGNRVVQAGEIVQTKSSVANTPITFRTLANATLLDGEDAITDVPVIATQPGSSGNVPAFAITEFTSAPFPNAVATNPIGFVSGKDTMSDPDYIDLIKKSELTKTKATDLAVKQAAINTQSSDDNKIVTSAEIRKPANRGEPSVLFVDDSTGYEPIFTGQGFESIIDSANGGEKYLQLQFQDVTKALVISSLQAPFSLTGNMTLSVKIGQVLSEHTFADADFSTPNAADTFEVVNSINANPNLLFSARSFNNGQNITLFAKDFQNEDVEVVAPLSGTDANMFLGFTKDITYTLRLYRDEVLLYKDGIVPKVTSNLQGSWSGSIADGMIFTVKVDGIQQTITVNNADFIPYGFATVNKNNSLSSWAAVLNSKIAGATFYEEAGRLVMESNKGASNTASVAIVGGSLVSSGLVFNAGDSDTGRAKDYNFNRSTGNIELSSPAIKGQSYAAGSRSTRAFADSASITGGLITLSVSPVPKIWLILDADVTPVAHSSVSGSTVTVSNPASNIWRYTTSVTGAFANVQKDDWVVIPDNAGFSSNNVGYWRVNAASGSYVEVRRSTGGTSESKVLAGTPDIVFARSSGHIQEIDLPSGLQSVSTIANTITSSLVGGFAESVGGTKIRIFSDTYSQDIGRVYVVSLNTSSNALGFAVGELDSSSVSHVAFLQSGDDNSFIEFIHDEIATGDSSGPYDSIVTSTNLQNLGVSTNTDFKWLNPYGINLSSNHDLRSDIESIVGTSVTLRDNLLMDDIIATDRYHIGYTYDFDALDNFIAIFDKDPTNKTFNVPMGRHATVYASAGANSFNAHDTDLGPTANFATSFGNNFDFSDFKIYMRARVELDPAGLNNKMLIRSASYGPSGDQTQVGIFYPVAESSSLSSSVSNGLLTSVQVFLSSGPLRSGGTWDGTTEFDVTQPVANTWRYTYNGTGTAPNFLSASIVTGDIVSISSASTFSSNNQGAFKVTAVTNIYFEITRYSGTAETNKTLSSASSLKFYPLAGDTAAQVGSYVNSNLSAWITAAQLESGSGAVSTSTYDDAAGSYSYIQLRDGENWVEASNVGTISLPVNLFTLKEPLSISGSDLIGEDLYVVPTRASQVVRWIDTFAVTGLTLSGNASLSNDATSVQLYSNLFGSSGAVEVSGGTANTSSAAVQDSANIVDSSYTRFAVPLTASRGFHRNQWVEISNEVKLAKNTNFNSGTQLQFMGAYASSPTRARVKVNNSNTSNVYQYGYFSTSRFHDADSTTEVRLEKQGKFVAISWTGGGTNPRFSKTMTVNNKQRTSGVSTIALTSSHGISVGSVLTIEVSINDSSFNGTFLALANGTSSFQYLQSLPDVTSAAATGSAVRRIYKGDRVVLSGSFTSGNAGEFKVANIYGDDTIYIENDLAQLGDYTLLSNSDIIVLSYDSVRPGDTLSIGTSLLDDTSIPTEIRKGEYVVDSVLNDLTIVVLTPNLSKNSTTMSVLSSDYVNVTVTEASPMSMYAKIANIAESPINVNYADVVLYGTELSAKITSNGASSMSAIGKLSFSTEIMIGEDSYKYYGGLISAVGQKIRGSSSDPVSLPGYAAAGSYIEVDSALKKRIQVSITVRNKTGTPFTTVRNRVQTAVASYINSLGVGEPVVFSEIVDAAQSIAGVQAVAISSPTYNATNDQIISQPDEKPIVLSLQSDIIVSQAV